MTSQFDVAPNTEKNLKFKGTLAGIATLVFVLWALWIVPGSLWLFESTVGTAIAGASALLYLSDRTRLGRWFYRFCWNWFHWEQMPPWSEIPKEKWRGWVYNQPLSQKITVASFIAIVSFVLSFIHLGVSASLFFQLMLGVIDVPVGLFGFAIGYGAHHLLLHKLPFVDSIDTWGDKLQNISVPDLGSVVKGAADTLLRSQKREVTPQPIEPVHTVAVKPEAPKEDPSDALQRYIKG